VVCPLFFKLPTSTSNTLWLEALVILEDVKSYRAKIVREWLEAMDNKTFQQEKNYEHH